MSLPPKQVEHGAMPIWSHDDRARHALQRTLRETVLGKISPGTRVIYESRVKPRFESEHGRPIADRSELRREMEKEPYYQMHAAIQRVAQELMWASVSRPLASQLGELSERCRARPSDKGTLTLDPDFAVPDYITALDIHCMPGGYAADLSPDDVSTGVLFDKGGYIYASGRGGTLNESMGVVTVRYVQREAPDLKPMRILDMGCTIGNSTLPYCDAFPEAEIHAIDVGPSMLRYAHARAEALGKAVHFSQQNAERTTFEDRSFDLIVSHIMMHEMPPDAVRNVLRESRRLLRPGGLMVHADAGQYAAMDLYRQFIYDSEVYNNNEPYWSTFRDLDLVALAEEAGFAEGEVWMDLEPFRPHSLSSPELDKSRTGRKDLQSNVLGMHLLVGRRPS